MRVAALLMTIWVFVAVPGLCLAGVPLHACSCEQAACGECGSGPGERSHRCHDDPCPDECCKPEQEDLLAADHSAEAGLWFGLTGPVTLPALPGIGPELDPAVPAPQPVGGPALLEHQPDPGARAVLLI